MRLTRIFVAGSITRTERNLQRRIHPSIQPMFQIVLNRIRQYLVESNLRLSAPPSEKWLTVKLHPKKAVLAFRNNRNRDLKFDIDTYADNDIEDERGLFLPPPPGKPNKRHVAIITSRTSAVDLKYYIDKMIDGMRIFDNSL